MDAATKAIIFPLWGYSAIGKLERGVAVTVVGVTLSICTGLLFAPVFWYVAYKDVQSNGTTTLEEVKAKLGV